MRDIILLNVRKHPEIYGSVDNVTIHPKREYEPWKALYIRGRHYLYNFQPEDIPKDVTYNTVVISPACGASYIYAATFILGDLESHLSV